MKKITTIFIDEDLLKEIKSKLALEGVSLSAWISNKIKEKLAEK